jgi:uncharacterized lipoprotein YehR (DUF1307 family)
MKKLVLLVLLVTIISFLGCEKKNSVTFKGPSGETASVTY